MPERHDQRPNPGRAEPAMTDSAAPISVDLLRSGALAALAAESQRPSSGATPVAEPTPGGSKRWHKPAIAAAVLVAVATAGIATVGGGDDDSTAPTSSSSAAPRHVEDSVASSVAAATTSVPGSGSAPSTAAETLPAAAPATPSSSVPTNTPAGQVAPAHRAVYRGGKLYMEGTVPSQAVADAYIAKAAAVLGADNVVDNYRIDPSVPESNDGTVYVDEPFLFDSGSAEINPAYSSVLNLGIAALNLNPAARMVVTGYTDNEGDPTKNVELSRTRAQAVVTYMVTTGGLDASRFDAIGAGDSNPVGDNSTEAGRQANRRIDVKLVNLLS